MYSRGRERKNCIAEGEGERVTGVFLGRKFLITKPSETGVKRFDILIVAG